MYNFYNFEDDNSTVFRDTVTIIAVVFICLFIIALPHINPKAKKDDNITEPAGNVIVNITWQDQIDADVDLWVKGPGDQHAVGYSNKNGVTFNLLRDDLGLIGDSTLLNYENAYTRGIKEGEYAVNVHMYSNRSSVWPIKVRIVVSVVTDVKGKSASKEIVATDVELHRDGEERTAIRFRLKSNGDLVQGSLNTLHLPLRSQ